MNSDSRGGTKAAPGKTFQTKSPGQNPPVKNLRELRQTPCVKTYVCMRVLLKIRGPTVQDV